MVQRDINANLGTNGRDGIAAGDMDQRRRFVETARELGCDEDDASFREKLAKIARQKTKKDNPAKPGPPKRTKS